MQKRRNRLGTLVSEVIIPGLVAAFFICIAGTLITAALISAERIKETSAAYGVVVTLMMAAFISAMVMIGRSKENKMIAAAINAVGMILMLMLGNFLAGAGPMNGFLQTALVVLAGTACAVLLNQTPKTKRKFRNRKY